MGDGETRKGLIFDVRFLEFCFFLHSLSIPPPFVAFMFYISRLGVSFPIATTFLANVVGFVTRMIDSRWRDARWWDGDDPDEQWLQFSAASKGVVVVAIGYFPPLAATKKLYRMESALFPHDLLFFLRYSSYHVLYFQSNYALPITCIHQEKNTCTQPFVGRLSLSNHRRLRHRHPLLLIPFVFLWHPWIVQGHSNHRLTVDVREHYSVIFTALDFRWKNPYGLLYKQSSPLKFPQPLITTFTSRSPPIMPETVVTNHDPTNIQNPQRTVWIGAEIQSRTAS